MPSAPASRVLDPQSPSPGVRSPRSQRATSSTCPGAPQLPCFQRAAPRVPAAPFHPLFPLSPRKSNSEWPVGSPRRQGVAGRAQRGAGLRAAPGALAPEGWLCAPGVPGPRSGARPKPSALPGKAGDSPETFGPDCSRAGVLLTSLPPTLRGWCPAGSLRPCSQRCPRPPSPYPHCQKCHSFSAFGCFAKSPCGRQELGGTAKCANPDDALSCPPAAAAVSPVRRAPGRGHRPPSTVRGPLPLPRAFPSRSGCCLPVPWVLIPLLMNILTEANAVEVN